MPTTRATFASQFVAPMSDSLNNALMVHAIITVATVVTERSSRLRDGMQVMGLEDSSFYAALFLSYALYHLPIYAFGAHWLLGPPGTRSGMTPEKLLPYSNV